MNKFFVASGALGFDGKGYWWEQPFRWLGYLDPSAFTIITKTYTLNPRRGNLRQYAPWRCVRLIPGGTVNAVGLTNPGIWAFRPGKYPIIVSVMPENVRDAILMQRRLEYIDRYEKKIIGVEVNCSCPNVQHSSDWEEICKVFKYPIYAKLGSHQLDLIPVLGHLVFGFDLINTVPWHNIFECQSPLSKYGLEGGVSGLPIATISRMALIQARTMTDKFIISGGGIYDINEARKRFVLGADGISFGTLFLKAPWKPNQIVREL